MIVPLHILTDQQLASRHHIGQDNSENVAPDIRVGSELLDASTPISAMQPLPQQAVMGVEEAQELVVAAAAAAMEAGTDFNSATALELMKAAEEARAAKAAEEAKAAAEAKADEELEEEEELEEIEVEEPDFPGEEEVEEFAHESLEKWEDIDFYKDEDDNVWDENMEFVGTYDDDDNTISFKEDYEPEE